MILLKVALLSAPRHRDGFQSCEKYLASLRTYFLLSPLFLPPFSLIRLNENPDLTGF